MTIVLKNEIQIIQQKKLYSGTSSHFSSSNCSNQKVLIEVLINVLIELLIKVPIKIRIEVLIVVLIEVLIEILIEVLNYLEERPIC